MLNNVEVYAMFSIVVKVDYVIISRKKYFINPTYNKVCIHYSSEKNLWFKLRDFIVDSILKENLKDQYKNSNIKKILRNKIGELMKSKDISCVKLMG